MLKNIENDIELLFRVKGIYNMAKLIIKANGEVLREVNKRFLTPGEMETVKIYAKELPASINEISLELEEV